MSSQSIIPIKRALLSVCDKTNLVPFAKSLSAFGIELISTGGTSRALGDAGVVHQKIEEITRMPEMLGGRVKTLHPLIHGGILGKRDQHAAEAKQHQVSWIDLVIVNFYPFAAVEDSPEKVEWIDIGGPALVRAAAKNSAWVGVVVDINDYDLVVDELQKNQGLTHETRRKLAHKAFCLTSQYDQAVAQFFAPKPVESQATLHLEFKKHSDLRYGENPHQKASVYLDKTPGVLSTRQFQGKPLSYNNLLDANAATQLLADLPNPSCVILKHNNPCGAAHGRSILEAYKKAYAADASSAFGSVIAVNEVCTEALVEALSQQFTEVFLAPAFEGAALTLLARKPNLRVLALPQNPPETFEFKWVSGGLLMQEIDRAALMPTDLNVITEVQPASFQDLLFAWQIVKHMKSNAISIVKDQCTVGLGMGQVSRIDAVDLALRKAGASVQGAVLASDGFFPFRDSIDRIAKTGIVAIIQPGGSIRDAEVIDACNEHGIAMVLTNKRCFKH